MIKIKDRKRQRLNRRLKHKEELLDNKNDLGVKDLTAYNAVKKYVGYLQTAAYITCQEPPHRAFMTSVLRYQRQTQRKGILSFLPELIMRDVRLYTLAFTAETVRWCIVAIQSSTPQSIPLTGRAIFMVLED